jgi:hypothetical protein
VAHAEAIFIHDRYDRMHRVSARDQRRPEPPLEEISSGGSGAVY